jgi:Flp pilus assembly pilin Flp
MGKGSTLLPIESRQLAALENWTLASRFRRGSSGTPKPALVAALTTSPSRGMMVPRKRDREVLGVVMVEVLDRLWAEDQGQDIAEYAVMLAVILVIVVGTLRMIGSNANNVFSSVASSVQ